MRIAKEEIETTLIERHSLEVQEKLEKARVAVAGCGGLGSNIAMALARIGVGHLHLIDFDIVDLSNLNRQHYFIRHLGMEKPKALKEQILEVNPYLDIKIDCVKITEQNFKTLFLEDEIICEAFDVPEQKAMLVNNILEEFPEKMLIAASGMAGYGDSNEIRTRRVTNHFYLCGDETTEIKNGCGLMAPRVAICAGHQANKVVQLILNHK